MRANVSTMMKNARRYERRGETQAALKVYEEILAAFPANQRAVQALEALAAQTADPAIEVLKSLEAEYHRKAYAMVAETGTLLMRQYPRSAILCNITGAAYQALAHYEEAEVCFRRAADLAPSDADAHSNLGVALKSQARIMPAIESYRRAVAANPAHAGAYLNLGNLLREIGRADDSLAVYREALRHHPANAEIHYNLAGTLQQEGQSAAAAEHSLQALRYDPGHDAARAHLLHQFAHLCDWQRMKPLLVDDLGVSRGVVEPFALLFFEDDPERQHLRAQNWWQDQSISKTAPLTSPPLIGSGGGERLKIGYFSADFHEHATVHLMADLLRRHDRKRFDIALYAYGRIRDQRTAALAAEDGLSFHDIADLSDAEAAAKARTDGLDIAIDLKGHTREKRLGIFARRAAPVQIHYLGYPGTTALPAMDYLIADPVIIPPSHRSFYTENILYLPDSYQPTDPTRRIAACEETRKDAGLPEDGFVFCCFNTAYKITPREFAIWMRLLQRVEGSVLWLCRPSPEAEANLRSAAARAGIDPARIVFCERRKHLDHLARHQLADLFLDTFNYNAHTTASDALFAGLPLVTRIGEQFAARVAASILTAAGLPDLIAESDEAYEKVAFDMATRPERLAAVRERLAANRETAPLFDSARYARALERAYEAAHSRHREGLAPKTITIAAETEIPTVPAA